MLLPLLICQLFVDPAVVGAAGVRRASITPPSFVRSATNSAGSSGTTFALGSSFDCTGGNYAIAAIAFRNTLTRTLSSVTNAGGQSFSAIMRTNLTSTGNLSLFGLANPTSGDVTLTFNNTLNQGVCLVMILLSGVSNTNGVDGSFSSSARTSESSAPASLATDLVIDAIGWAVTSGIDVSSSQTVRGIGTNTAAGVVALTVSTKAGSAGTTTIAGAASGAGAIMSQVATSISGQ